MNKDKCHHALNQAAAIVELMQEFLQNPVRDSAQAYFEACLDAKRCLDTALHEALTPLLEGIDTSAQWNLSKASADLSQKQ